MKHLIEKKKNKTDIDKEKDNMFIRYEQINEPSKIYLVVFQV